ncbi:MAG: carbohydrate ABC transporter permease [Clostridiaceae bacterium]|nr:carbohydrate ABC transporter permease [Clostridiaceae bacterium]
MENKKSSRISLSFIHLFFILFSLACVVPFLLLISISLSSDLNIIKYGYSLIPKVIDLTAYKYVFTNPAVVVNAYGVTIFVTAVGTVLSTFIIALFAYPLSRSSFKYKNIFMFFTFFTMLFNGGLVPSYILLTKYLHLNDTIWIMIIPGLVNVWFVIMVRTFFKQIPEAICESAKIDGASEFTIFFKLILPLSKPVLATIALMGALGRWNDWYTAMLFIDNEKLYPIQYVLQKIMLELQFLQNNMDKIPIEMIEKVNDIPTESVRMALCIVAAGPMICIFPFFQKYFVKGMTVGAIKG